MARHPIFQAVEELDQRANRHLGLDDDAGSIGGIFDYIRLDPDRDELGEFFAERLPDRMLSAGLDPDTLDRGVYTVLVTVASEMLAIGWHARGIADDDPVIHLQRRGDL